MRDSNRPLEKPHLRAMINSALDYLAAIHGAFVEVAVKDWLADKEKRLEGLRNTGEREALTD